MYCRVWKKMLTNIILFNVIVLAFVGGNSMKNNVVTQPKHYTDQIIETIHILDDMGLPRNLERAVEYMMRSEKKGGEEDLKKALWYLTRDMMIRHNTSPIEIYNIVDGSIDKSTEYIKLKEIKNEKHIR